MEINNASIDSAATEYDSKVNLKEAANPPMDIAHGEGRYILPIILLIDCSTSFEIIRKDINAAVYELIATLKEQLDANIVGKDIDLTLITFNHTPEIIYQGVFIGNLETEQWTPLKKKCSGTTRLGPALEQAIHLGKAQHDYLQEQMVNGYKPMYFVFSDFINTAGKGASPEQTKKWQAEFETVAQSIKDASKAKRHVFVSCVYQHKMFAEDSQNNALKLTDPAHTFFLNTKDATTISKGLMAFFSHVIVLSAASQEPDKTLIEMESNDILVKLDL